MPRFVGGPWDGQPTEEVRRATLFMPIRGTDYIAVYKRDWKSGNYVYFERIHENFVLGARKIKPDQ